MSINTQTKAQRSADMLVRVRRAAQITLPSEVRQRLGIREGDYLEAEVTEKGVLLKPISVVEREKAWDELMEIINRPKWRGPGPEPSEDEVMEMVVEEIHAMRNEHEGGSR